MHLTGTQKVAYLELLMAYWIRHELPDDDRVLAHIAGLNLRHWQAIGSSVKALFTPSNCQDAQPSNCQDVADSNCQAGACAECKPQVNLRHARLDAEIARAKAVSEVRKAAGNKGLEKRYGKQMPKQLPAEKLANANPSTVQEEVVETPTGFLATSSGALLERDERLEGARALAARPTTTTPEPPPAEPRLPPTEEQLAAVAETLKAIQGYVPRPVDPVRTRDEQLEILRAHSIQPNTTQDRAIPAIRKPGLNGSGEHH